MCGKRNPEKPDNMPNPESDWLDVTVPSVSGHYIELEQQGKLDELLRLKKERERLTRDLMVINSELSQFNNPSWLLDSYIRIRNQGRRFGSALKSEADQLERRKEKLNAELEAVEKQITRIDPLILAIPLPQVTEINSQSIHPRNAQNASGVRASSLPRNAPAAASASG